MFDILWFLKRTMMGIMMDKDVKKKIKYKYIKNPVDSENMPILLHDRIGVRGIYDDSTEAYTVKSMTYTDQGWILVVKTTEGKITTIRNSEISTYHIPISKEEMFAKIMNDISKVTNAHLNNQISAISAMKKIEQLEHKYRTMMINN